MTLSLGRKLSIRSMVYVAGAPIPFFWPMRNFIHHNPLHGLEKLSFQEATEKAQTLFHARTSLSRTEYQAYLQQDSVCSQTLLNAINNLASEYDDIHSIDLPQWLLNILTQLQLPVTPTNVSLNSIELSTQVNAALHGDPIQSNPSELADNIKQHMHSVLSADRPIYESIDLLYGTDIGEHLDEMVIKSCLDFYDEGQSVWSMPLRERGFFNAWSKMATRNRWISPRAKRIYRIVKSSDSPEGVIEHVLQLLQVPESEWLNYITRELSRLHGWAGFIRWRESAKNYYWNREYPGDLVSYLAVRMTLVAALLAEQHLKPRLLTIRDIQNLIEQKPFESYLRYEYHSGEVLPAWAQRVEQTLSTANNTTIKRLCQDYLKQKHAFSAQQCAHQLNKLASLSDSHKALHQLNDSQLDKLLTAIRELEKNESMFWLNAMEAKAMQNLLSNVTTNESELRDKRPFAQALFCIDTRSERIRRHLESVGDYQTFGIAGFFGVPFSFMELGKGSETHLCPIILTPKNLVIEISQGEHTIDEAAISTLEKALHELKESILTPFVTVEAIGLLFGFDMIGKTVAPKTYQHWRKHLHNDKPVTHLLLDKLNREQADSIVRAVQRSVIVHAIEHELGLPTELITDNVVKELRECAMEHLTECPTIIKELQLDETAVREFVEKLKTSYSINASFVRYQMERLGRIGFSIEEQAGFVSTALRSIGLTKQFSRFVLLFGHGSTSDNNPFESALDCGACGGNHGLTNARVLARMANKHQVRNKLKQQGLEIDDDVWFIPAMHNTTTDELTLYDLDLLPSSHLIYLDRLRNGLKAASRFCAKERLPSLSSSKVEDPGKAYLEIQRNAVDWSQVRPEWGLSGNVYFIIGRRDLTRNANLQGRSFLHSYDYKDDPKYRLLENILGGPLVVGQWINMEHYFSTVDNERFGSGSKVYHNVAGRFGVMTGNLSDLRTGLPAQTVLKNGAPHHEPMRLITVIEAPFDHATRAIQAVAAVNRLVLNYWIRLIIIDPETHKTYLYEDDQWDEYELTQLQQLTPISEEKSL